MALKEFKNDQRRVRLTTASKQIIPPKPLTQLDMKIAISSHHTYYDKTKDKIHTSLLNAHVPENIIYYFISDESVLDIGYKWLDNNTCLIPHNSFDFNAIVSVIEQNLQHDRWFFMHDTCYVGPLFYEKLLNFNHENKNIISLMKPPKANMNMGSISNKKLKELEKEILLNYKNNSFDSKICNEFKSKLVREEGKLFNSENNFYCSSVKNSEIQNTYSNTQRLLEYYEDLDFYKVKANWEQKQNWIIQA